MNRGTIGALAFALLAVGATSALAGDLDVIVGGSVAAVKRHGGSVKGSAGPGALAARVPASKIDELRGDADVTYVEEDAVATKCTATFSNDPSTDLQWGIPKVVAPSAWAIGINGTGTVIAVCDTGLALDATATDFAHIDLKGKFAGQYEKYYVGAPYDGHATHVSGIAAADTDNGIGVAGMAPGALVMSVRVLDSTGSGSYSAVADGINHAADSGSAKVINLSLGGSTSSTTLQNAVNYAWSKGLVIAAAAGNSGSTRIFYPAGYTNCIAVAATTQTDGLAFYSNRNARKSNWVDLAAPGGDASGGAGDIYSTLPNDSYGYEAGTSMATPHVSGAAALVWQALGAGATNSAVRTRLESDADALAGLSAYVNGGRRLNAYRAVIGQ